MVAGPAAGVVVRPATPDDAAAYVGCHVECLAETYATIMPPAFAEQHRQAVGQRIEDTRREWARRRAEGEHLGVGLAERTRVWVAVESGGEVVGVARSGPGPQQWEDQLGAPPPVVGFQLHHVYTRQRVHGSGAGQALLDAAVGDRDAYLWILHGNARAERFYRRNGFTAEDVVLSCGPTWFSRTMFRMLRRAQPTDGLPAVCPSLRWRDGEHG